MKTATVLSTTFMSFTLFAGVSQAAEPLPANNGYGWKVKSTNGVAWGLKHNSVYTIKFVYQDSLMKSRPYMQNTIDYLNGMKSINDAGIDFRLSSEIEGATNWKNKPDNWQCLGPRGTIYVVVAPVAKKNYSYAYSCYDGDYNAYGGYMVMNRDYWKQASSHARTRGLRNIHAHELGHMLGLDHPKYFSDSNLKPVMNDPAGGYQFWKSAGKYPPDDTRGINRLVSNDS